MDKKIKIITLIIGCIILLGIAGMYIRQSNYVNENLENIRMSYRIEGAKSPYRYAEVNIVGDKAKTSFHLYPYEETEVERKLHEDIVKDFLKKYQEMDFFNIDVKDDKLVEDAGITTISFQINGKNRTVSYTYTDDKNIRELVSMYWKIISQESYLLQLKDYQKKDKGEVANTLSSLSADIREGRILDSSEFIPVLKEILSDEEQRESLGQYAVHCLEEISGEDYGWDYNKWLKWIDEKY